MRDTKQKLKEVEDGARQLLQALSMPEGRPNGNLLEQVPTWLVLDLLQYGRGTSDAEGRKLLQAKIEGIYQLKDWARNERLRLEQKEIT